MNRALHRRPSEQCMIKQLFDSVFVISLINKVSVSVMLSALAFGSADNTYPNCLQKQFRVGQIRNQLSNATRASCLC